MLRFGGKIPEPEVVSGLGINKGMGGVGWRVNSMLGFFWVRNFGVRDRSLGGLILPSSALFFQDLLYLKHATCLNTHRNGSNGEHP